MTSMKRFITFMLLLIIVSATTFAQNKDRRKSFKSWDNYEITTEKVGVEGTKFVKVWGFGKTEDKAIMAAKRNAIHACLFRGLPGGTNVNATPAICSNPNAFDDNYDYFCNFFQSGGDYLKYVNMTTDGVPSGQDKRKVKGGYKCAIYVQVMFDNLKRQMETDGIIRKLNTGF